VFLRKAKGVAAAIWDGFAHRKRMLDAFALRLRAASASEMHLPCAKSS
jgi:hypothetical protein